MATGTTTTGPGPPCSPRPGQAAPAASEHPAHQPARREATVKAAGMAPVGSRVTSLHVGTDLGVLPPGWKPLTEAKSSPANECLRGVGKLHLLLERLGPNYSSGSKAVLKNPQNAKDSPADRGWGAAEYHVSSVQRKRKARVLGLSCGLRRPTRKNKQTKTLSPPIPVFKRRKRASLSRGKHSQGNQ